MTDAAEIRALEDRRYAATIAGDVAELDRLLADTLVYTHSNASIDTKASYIESLSSGRLRYRSMHRSNETVVVYDGAAVVSARVELAITVGGVDRTVNAQATVTWVRQGDGWRFAAWQSTPVPA